MSQNPLNNLNKEFAELLTGMSEETLTDEQFQRLTHIISNDLAAREFYIRYTDVEARLRKHHGTLASDSQAQTAAENILLEVIKIEEESRINLEHEKERQKLLYQTHQISKVSKTESVKNYNQFVIPRAAALLSLAAMIIISCTIAYQFLTINDETANIITSSSSPVDTTSVAILSNTQQLKWDPSSTPILENNLMTKGQYLLNEGIAQIVFNSGVKAIIEAPAAFIITSDNACILNNGKISAHIPKDKPDAIGFKIHSPDVLAVDMGTEFCLLVNNVNTELHVIDGQVDATLISNYTTQNTQSKLSLYENNAKSFDGINGVVRYLKPNPRKFFTRWDDVLASKLEISGQIKYVRNTPTNLAPDKYENDDFIMLINEGAGIILNHDLKVDMDSPSLYPDDFHGKFKQKTLKGIIPKNTRITSYLLQLDPYGNSANEIVKRSGTITFASPVLGIIIRDKNLLATDSYLGAPNTAYPNLAIMTDKEKEQTRGIGELERDMVYLSKDRRTISVNWVAGKGADAIRILIGSESDLQKMNKK